MYEIFFRIDLAIITLEIPFDIGVSMKNVNPICLPIGTKLSVSTDRMGITDFLVAGNIYTLKSNHFEIRIYQRINFRLGE